MKYAYRFVSLAAVVGTALVGAGCQSAGGVSDAQSAVDATRIVEGEPSYVHGAIDKDAVRDVVKSHLKDVRMCGQYHELLRDSGANGNVVVGFIIDKTGEVTVTRVAGSTMNNPEVEACVAKAVTGWRFPSPSSDKAEIAFPFSFKSDKDIRTPAVVTVEVSSAEEYVPETTEQMFPAPAPAATLAPAPAAEAPAAPSRIADKD